jgi:hypothetical protein
VFLFLLGDTMKPKQKVEWDFLTPEERKEKVRYHANNCAAHGWAKRWLRKHGDKQLPEMKNA